MISAMPLLPTLLTLSRPGGIITIKGNVAALNTITHRESSLIGWQLSLFQEETSLRKGRTRGSESTASASLKQIQSRQPSLFQEEQVVPTDPDQPFLPSLQPGQQLSSLMDRLLDGGQTVLDRLHQAMLLFGRSQTSLLRPFLTETYMGTDPRFWRLANALSALYPSGTDEKRWIDGVLARKKGLGF